VKDLITKDAVVFVLVAYEYADKTSRIPARVRFRMAIAKSASSWAVENNGE
jgi:hypothetical protein